MRVAVSRRTKVKRMNSTSMQIVMETRSVENESRGVTMDRLVASNVGG
jgi:hypothetical protein